MTPRLRALLIAVGTVTVIGTATLVSVYRPGSTGAGKAQLTDAGLLLCPQVRLACRVRNLCRSLGSRYGTWEVCARDCGALDGGGGYVLRWPTVDGGTQQGTGGQGAECLEVLGACEPTGGALPPGDKFCSDDGGAGGMFPSRIVADACACSPGEGVGCEMLGDDGGWGEALLGMTLMAGAWRGACLRKPCVEAAGEQGASWPVGCPE